MTTGLSKFFRGKSASTPRVPRASRIVRISELLAGNANEFVKLSLVPAIGEGTASIDYAAASVAERIVLGAFVKQLRPTRIFEIGTFRGLTALALAANCDWDAQLWTLDLPPDLTAEDVNNRYYSSNPQSGFKKLAEAKTERFVGTALKDFHGKCQVEQIYCDAAEFDFSAYAPIDLFFVDGCHEYAAAKRDTLAAWQTVRPGGRVVWHDFTWPDVEKAIHEAMPDVAVAWVEGTTIAFADKP